MADHPIKPPAEVEQKWLEMWPQDALTAACRWGADVELDACCGWLDCRFGGAVPRDLYASRRPNLVTQKRRGLRALADSGLSVSDPLLHQEILGALEALPG